MKVEKPLRTFAVIFGALSLLIGAVSLVFIEIAVVLLMGPGLLFFGTLLFQGDLPFTDPNLQGYEPIIGIIAALFAIYFMFRVFKEWKKKRFCLEQDGSGNFIIALIAIYIFALPFTLAISIILSLLAIFVDKDKILERINKITRPFVKAV